MHDCDCRGAAHGKTAAAMNVWHVRHQPGEKLLAATRLLKDIHLCHCDGGLKVANSSTLPDTTLTCSRKGASPNVTMSPPIVLKTNVLMSPPIGLEERIAGHQAHDQAKNRNIFRSKLAALEGQLEAGEQILHRHAESAVGHLLVAELQS